MRRKVLNLEDVVIRLEQRAKQSGKIKPFEGDILQCSIVQVEPIYVDACPHVLLTKETRASEEAPS